MLWSKLSVRLLDIFVECSFGDVESQRRRSISAGSPTSMNVLGEYTTEQRKGLACHRRLCDSRLDVKYQWLKA